MERNSSSVIQAYKTGMQQHIKNQFNFTKKEQGGIIALVAVIAFLWAVPVIYKALKPAEKITAEDRAAIQKLELIAHQWSKEGNNRAGKKVKKTVKAVTLFRFDPNTLPLEGWQQLGLSFKQAQAILNYIAKGGRFFKPEDLQKMYTISPEVYQQLLPYVFISTEKFVASKNVNNKELPYKKSTLKIVSLNAADTAALEEIKGIGPAFARRIIKYRDKLGGFYTASQLLEVYGMDSVRYRDLQAQVSIDLSGIKMININTATFESLKFNPYLRYKQINAIIAYRNQHGPFKNLAALKEVVALDEGTIKKLTPYLIFQDD